MARTGRFGRMPKAAPDLTSTIVQMLREYNTQVDQNFVDAWKNGGNVDGKPVTDGRLLAHFQSRRNQLSKDDPMYDQWSNRIDQYTFSIDDSKMQVKYDNGKANDAQMAAFYQKWADKTPDNTEFDRQLLSAVGKYRAASAAKGRAGRAAAGVSQFKTDITRIEDNGPKQAAAANDALVKFAVDTGIMPANAKSLANLDVSSGRSAELLDILKDGIDNGNPVVQARIGVLTAELKKIDPKFDWANAQSWFSQTFEKGAKGNDAGLQYLQGSKYSTDAWVQHFTNDKANVQFAATKINGLGIQNDAKANSDWLDNQLSAAHGNPYLEQAAFTEYNQRQAGVIGQLQKAQVGDYQDPLLIGMINEQRNYQLAQGGGTDKPQDDWRDAVAGATSQGGPGGGAGAARYAYAQSTKAGLDLLAKGGWMQIAQDPTDPTGTKAVYQIQAKETLPAFGAILLPGASIKDPATGAMIPVYATPQPVQMTTVNEGGSPIGTPSLIYDANGQPQPIKKADGTNATNPDGSIKYQETGTNSGIEAIRSVDSSGNSYFIYRTRAHDGTYVMSLDPPLIPGAKATPRVDSSGNVTLQITVDPTMVDATGAARPTTNAPAAAAGVPPTAPGVSPAVLATLNQRAAAARANGVPDANNQYLQEINRLGATTTGVAGGTGATSTFGPSTTIQSNQGYSPSYGVGYDATKFIDTTATNVNPQTGELNSGYYRSSLGLSLAHEFDVLKRDDPDFQKKLNALTAQVQGGQLTLQSMYQTAQARGDQGEMARAAAELNMWGHDQSNLALEVGKATNQTVDPASLLTSPANPVNASYGMMPNGAAVNPQTNGEMRLQTPEAVSKFTANQATNQFDVSRLAFQATGQPGAPGATGVSPRELKLPGLGAAPLLKPLLPFVSGAGVPQLAPNAVTPQAVPGVQGGIAGPPAPNIPAPTAPISGPKPPAPPTPPPAAPKPPTPPPTAPPPYTGGVGPTAAQNAQYDVSRLIYGQPK